MNLRRRTESLLERLGYELQTHTGARRQRILAHYGIDLVLDVGAARGSYAKQLRQFGYRGRIVSFEPLHDAFSALQASSSTDERWIAENFALGDQTGDASINVASNGDSSSFLPMLQAHKAAAPSARNLGFESVKIRRLDDVIASYCLDGSRAYLKIDTQGYERAVLSGARDTVSKLVGLQLELSFVPLYDGAMLVDEAVHWAYSSGFILVSIERGFRGQDGQLLQADGIFVRGGSD